MRNPPANPRTASSASLVQDFSKLASTLAQGKYKRKPIVTAQGKSKADGGHERMQFEGQTAIVTGGARGIGAAIATRLAKEGARVLIADIDQEAAQTAAEHIGKGAIAY